MKYENVKGMVLRHVVDIPYNLLELNAVNEDYVRNKVLSVCSCHNIESYISILLN